MTEELKEYLIKSKEKAHIKYQELVDKVLETGNINYQDEDGWCLLHWFSLDFDENKYFRYSSKVIIELLLENGANPNLQADTGHTPLHKASYTPGKNEIVKKLLKYGANPYIKDKRGLLPIDYAAKFRIQKNVELLNNIDKIQNEEELEKTDEKRKIEEIKLKLQKQLK